MEPLHELVVIDVGRTEGIVHALRECHRRLRRDLVFGVMLVEVGMAAAGDAEILLDGIEDRKGFLICLLYTSPSPRDGLLSRMPSSA